MFQVIPGRMTLLITIFLVLINIFNTIQTNSPQVNNISSLLQLPFFPNYKLYINFNTYQITSFNNSFKANHWLNCHHHSDCYLPARLRVWQPWRLGSLDVLYSCSPLWWSTLASFSRWSCANCTALGGKKILTLSRTSLS